MRRESGALEDAVIDVLEAAGAALSVSQVRAALDGELAHTTVMTALTRLTRKGLLTRTRQGRAYTYELAVRTGEMPALKAAMRMRRELDGRVERADVLANFVAGLAPEDEAVLAELLDKSGDDAKRRR